MGLFSKKVCSFCNKPLGMLDSVLSTKLADGHILGNCCSKLVSHYAYCIPLTSLTKDQVLEHMNEVQIMRNKIATEFEVTDVITEYKNPSNILVSIDRNRRLWIPAEEKDELFSIDHITRFDADLDYSSKEDNVFPRAPYTPPRADLPEPFRKRDMRAMDLWIYVENHPYKIGAPIVLKIVKHGPEPHQSYEAYYDEVYGYAAKCIELFESLM